MRPLDNELPEGWEADVSYLLPGWRYDAVVAAVRGLILATKGGRKRFGDPPPAGKRCALDIIEEHHPFDSPGFRPVETEVMRHVRWWLAKNRQGQGMDEVEEKVVLILRHRGWSTRRIARHLGRNPNSLYRPIQRLEAAA